MSYNVEVFIGINTLDFNGLKVFIEALYAKHNKSLSFKFIPYRKTTSEEDGIFEALMPDQRSWITLIQCTGFENDEEINFNLYSYYINFQGFKDRNYNVEKVKEEGHWLFNKLKEVGKYELLLLYDMQLVIEKFTP